MAHRRLEVRDRAAVSSGAMDGVLVVIKMFFQLVMEQLYGALMVFPRYLTQAPRTLEFSWEILVYVAVIVVIVKRLYNLKKEKEAAQQLTDKAEEYGKFSQKTRLFTQAYEAVKSPPKVDSPLKLQTLCLAIFHKGMNSFTSLPGDSLKEQKSKFPKLLFHTMMITRLQAQTRLLQESSESLRLQVIETKDILRTSQNNVNQVQREIMCGLSKIAHLQENFKVLSQEVTEWTERVWEGREQQKC